MQSRRGDGIPLAAPQRPTPAYSSAMTLAELVKHCFTKARSKRPAPGADLRAYARACSAPALRPSEVAPHFQVLHGAGGRPVGIISSAEDSIAGYDTLRYARIRVAAPYETPLPDWPPVGGADAPSTSAKPAASAGSSPCALRPSFGESPATDGWRQSRRPAPPGCAH